MNEPLMSRSQRRVEKRQAVILLTVILAVALISFVLGVMVGRNGAPETAAIPEPNPVRLPVAAPQETPIAETQPTPKVSEPEKLTFYETLPRGETQPLGSGINLPPQTTAPPKADLKPAAVIKPPPAALHPPAETHPLSLSNTAGAYLVQAASFRQLDEARAFQEKLTGKDYPAYVEKIDLGSKGVWFRVLTGPFKGPDQAQKIAAKLHDEFRITPIVKKR